MGDYDDGDNPLVSVYRTSELPEKFHWKRSRFMPGIVIMTRPGATVLTVSGADSADSQTVLPIYDIAVEFDYQGHLIT